MAGWRRWLFPALAVFLLVYVAMHRGELGAITRTLAGGAPAWIAAAIACEALYFATFARLYAAAMTWVGAPSRVRDTLPVLLGALVVNVALPSAGAAGATLLVDDAARRGRPAARAAAGVGLGVAMEYAAFSAFLGAALLALARGRGIGPAEVAGTAAIVVFDLALLAVFAVWLWRPSALRAVLEWVDLALTAGTRALQLRSPLADGWPERASAELIAAAGAVRAEWWRFGALLATALLAHALNAACMAALFAAFGEPVRPGVVLLGYALGQLAWIVAPVPQGIGVVEGVIALVLASLGVPVAVAGAVALAYRGLAFWLPMAVGFVLLRRLRSLRATT